MFSSVYPLAGCQHTVARGLERCMTWSWWWEKHLAKCKAKGVSNGLMLELVFFSC
jgi:hypothetical protein